MGVQDFCGVCRAKLTVRKIRHDSEGLARARGDSTFDDLTDQHRAGNAADGHCYHSQVLNTIE